MAYEAVDKNGSENIYQKLPSKAIVDYRTDYAFFYIPEGSIEKLIGRKLAWEDEPVELKEQL